MFFSRSSRSTEGDLLKNMITYLTLVYYICTCDTVLPLAENSHVILDGKICKLYWMHHTFAIWMEVACLLSSIFRVGLKYYTVFREV